MVLHSAADVNTIILETIRQSTNEIVISLYLHILINVFHLLYIFINGVQNGSVFGTSFPILLYLKRKVIALPFHHSVIL